jgi:hypothetical protein
MTAHKVLRGITYGSKRAEAGDVVSDIPSASVKWLTEQGIIEPADTSKPSKPDKREPVSEDKGDK